MALPTNSLGRDPVGRDVAPRELGRRVHGSHRVTAGTPLLVPLPDEAGLTDAPFDRAPDLEALPEERWLMIEVNGRTAARLRCSPGAAAELAVGWAFLHGVLDTPRSLGRVTTHEDRVALMLAFHPDSDTTVWSNRPIGSGHRDADPDVPWPDEERDDPRIELLSTPGASAVSTVVETVVADEDRRRWPRQALLALTDRVLTRFGTDEPGAAPLHQVAAGETHGARGVCLARDVDQANAIAKLVGWTILEDVPRADLILFLSGHVDAATARAASRAGMAAVVSRSLPTRAAVVAANAGGVMLIGRGTTGGWAVYSSPERLVDDGDSATTTAVVP